MSVKIGETLSTVQAPDTIRLRQRVTSRALRAGGAGESRRRRVRL